MTVTRVFNNFKKRYLAGEVEPSIKCSAYLMNSGYEATFNNKSYFRHIDDFTTYNENALYVDSRDALAGSALASGALIRNTYYHETNELDENKNEGQIIVVTEDNIDKYSRLLVDKDGKLPSKYSEYLHKFSQFFLIGRSDEFQKLIKYCQDNLLETFAVVLYDDIENVTIKNSCFGCTQQHPFRGIFDGNGYNIYIKSITMNDNSYACGLFGYISESAIVKNLTILAQPTELNKYNLTDDVNSIVVTVNNSDKLISLKSIKNGCNDVCIGVLAGVNHGTLENIVVSADVVYDSIIRPDVYLIQNKAGETDGTNKKLISSNILAAGIENDFDNTTKLSAFDNFCYPTQLCLNSLANMVPYVGYFNEGSFNTQTVDSTRAKEPLYRAAASAQYFDRAFWKSSINISPGEPKDIEQMESHCTYCNDIFQQYKTTREDDKTHWMDVNFALAGISYNKDKFIKVDDDDYSVPESAKYPFSFRLGPNSKQAFLIGGVVGFNNGNISHLANVETLKFNNNIVALVGGVAGRACRGYLDDIHTRVIYSGSSGMYTDQITINDNTATHPTCNINVSLTNLSSHAFSTMRSLTLYDTSHAATNVTGLVDASIPVNARANITFSANTIVPYAKLYLRESTSDVYERYYDFLTESTDKRAVVNNTSDNFTITVNTTTGTMAVLNAKITDAALGGDCHVCVTNNNAFLLRTQNSYSACSSYNDMPVITGGASDLEKIAYIVPVFTINFSGICNNLECEGTLDIPYSAFSANAQCIVSDVNLNEFYRNSENFTVKLPPVYNIGGMFGEYLYTNGQSVNDSTVYASFKGFLPSGVTTDTSAENTMSHTNKFANFACNITIDSVNKSDNNIYTADSELASADSVVRNDLRCKVLTLINNSEQDPALYSKWHSETANASYLGGYGTFAYYLNCYNQIAPGLVTTHYTDNLHRKAETRWAILGLQYEDDLFFKYGLNMGDTWYGSTGSRKEYAKQLATPQPANSGIYFNYPAQQSSFNYRTTLVNPDQSICDWHTVLPAAFDTYDTSDSTSKSVVYVTKQLNDYPDHYPLYRGKASLTAFDNNVTGLTFNTNAYNTVDCMINTSAVYASAMTDKANVLVNKLIDIQPANNTPNYIYTYSSTCVFEGALPPIECNLSFADEYTQLSTYNTYPKAVIAHTVDETRVLDAIDKQKYNKAYVLSSDSYLIPYLDNPATFKHMAQINSTDVGVPAYKLPNAIVPTPQVEVSGALITYGNHYVLNTPYEIQERISDSYFGYAHRYAKLASVSDIRIGISHVGRILENTATHEMLYRHYNDGGRIDYNNDDDKFYVHRQVMINEDISSFERVPEPVTDYKCADDVIYMTFELFATSSYFVDGEQQQTRISEKYLMSARIIDSVPDFDKILFKDDDNETLTANSIVYGYIPQTQNIVQALDRTIYSTLNCTGVSANDLQYMLLIDEQRRPILDVKLDTTAVDNAGYTVKFDNVGDMKLNSVPLTPIKLVNYKTSGGLAINIENGNK